MKRTKLAVIALSIILTSVALVGCRESQRVSHNISLQADNFNVMRRITVFNIRTDTVLMQMTGRFSLQNNSSNELVVLCEVEKGKYQKHFVYLNEWTMYTVEDLNGVNTTPYAYELEFMPQALKPVQITFDELKEDVGNWIQYNETE